MLKWTFLARLRGAKPIFLSVGFSGLDARLSRFFTRKALSHRRIQVVSRSWIARIS